MNKPTVCHLHETQPMWLNFLTSITTPSFPIPTLIDTFVTKSWLPGTRHYSQNNFSDNWLGHKMFSPLIGIEPQLPRVYGKPNLIFYVCFLPARINNNRKISSCIRRCVAASSKGHDTNVLLCMSCLELLNNSDKKYHSEKFLLQEAFNTSITIRFAQSIKSTSHSRQSSVGLLFPTHTYIHAQSDILLTFSLAPLAPTFLSEQLNWIELTELIGFAIPLAARHQPYWVNNCRVCDSTGGPPPTSLSELLNGIGLNWLRGVAILLAGRSQPYWVNCRVCVTPHQVRPGA